MIFYFVYQDKDNLEKDIIRELQPPGLFLSHKYFYLKELPDIFGKIGYKPDILYHAGSGTRIEEYIDDIRDKQEHLTNYLCYDVPGDNEQTYQKYLHMRRSGLRPAPVYQYNGSLTFPEIERYIEHGEKVIALGTRGIPSTKAAGDWARLITWLYPETRFIYLGTGSKQILDHVDLYAATASTWIRSAGFGKPRHVPGGKKEKATYNMKELLNIPGGENQ
nr:MAG TPA_asm: hypothetical protein [Caudoviricetes sp.]